MMTTGQTWLFIAQFILMCVIMVMIARGNRGEDVTHWMPLPEPPEEEEKYG